MGVYADASGALFALLETRDGDPAAEPPAVNDFLWNELWTHDIPGSVEFYSNVLGLSHDVRELGSGSYQTLRRADAPVLGVLEHPVADARPVWANYLRVEDPAAIHERAKQRDLPDETIGSKVLHAPWGEVDADLVAILQDALDLEGAFGLQSLKERVEVGWVDANGALGSIGAGVVLGAGHEIGDDDDAEREHGVAQVQRAELHGAVARFGGRPGGGPGLIALAHLGRGPGDAEGDPPDDDAAFFLVLAVVVAHGSELTAGGGGGKALVRPAGSSQRHPRGPRRVVGR